MKLMNTALTMSVLMLAGCEQPQIGIFEFPEGSVQHVVRAAEIDWRPCPPNLPPGCEIAVLEGDPQSAGLFTVRFRITEDFELPPHTHPKDERVTVLAGQVSVAFGGDATRERAIVFGPGDYYVNARDAIHAVYIDDSSELQITGIGPWEVHLGE